MENYLTNKNSFCIFGLNKTKVLNTKNKRAKNNYSIGENIRQLRKAQNLPLRKVAALLDIDQSYLSKFERNEKMPTKEQIIKLAKIFNVDENELILQLLSDKIVYEIKNEELGFEAIKVAEKKLNSYLK